MSVHITPEKYSGRHTDQSQEPLMADQPSSAPQLNVSPEHNKKEVHQAEQSCINGIIIIIMGVYTQNQLWPVGDPFHQWVGEDER